MTKTTHSLRLAGTAVATVLAFTSTAALSQDPAAPFPAAPEPVIVVPDIPVPATPPQPTIVLPTALPETTSVTPPAAVPLPQPEAATAAPPATLRTRAPAPAAERAAPAPVTSTSAETPTSVAEPVIADLPPPVVQNPVAPVAVAEEPAAPASDNTGIIALVIGGLLAFALAIWGFIAIGRRKPMPRRAEVRLAERPAPAPVVRQPAVAAIPVAAAPATSLEPAPPEGRFAPRVQPIFAQRSGATSGGLAHTGASVALPREVPASFEDREALFRRMVDAKPDRANPFSDRKARMKRARLILQSLGRDFGEAKPWIDLSQYPNNWPELAAQRHAAA